MHFEDLERSRDDLPVEYMSSPAKLRQDIQVFLCFHKNNGVHYKGIPFINEWGTSKDPLLKNFVRRSSWKVLVLSD